MNLYIFKGYKDAGYSSRELLFMALKLYKEEMRLDIVDNPKVISSDLGKPFFENAPVSFSISHTSDMWACVMRPSHKGNIGLDLELIKENSHLKLAKKYFDTSEYEYAEKGGNQGFYGLWTCKEAIAKESGSSVFSGMRKGILKDGRISTKFEEKDLYRLIIDDNCCAAIYGAGVFDEGLCLRKMNY